MIGCVEARMKGRGRAERSLAPAGEEEEEEEEEEGPVGRGDKFGGCGGEARIGIVLLLLMSLLSPALEDGLVRFAQEDDGEG